MHLLYLNDDKTLHDCMDMEENNVYYSDAVKVSDCRTTTVLFSSFSIRQDYQSYRSTKRTASVSSTSSNPSESLIFETPNLQLVNNNLPAKTSTNSPILETKLVHIGQSTGVFLASIVHTLTCNRLF